MGRRPWPDTRRASQRSVAISTAIAIDGPVASGKSSVGSAVATALGWPFVDTGTMYRAITWLALQRDVDLTEPAALGALAEQVNMRVRPPAAGTAEYATVYVDGEDATPFLRTPAVERAVSLVSAVPAVRRCMVRLQRELAADHPVVMAGRDIGTVVLLDARLKVYLDAPAAARARRRAAELEQRGRQRPYAEVLEETLRRDALDSERADSPLRPADDAVVIQTATLDEAQTVAQVIGRARALFAVVQEAPHDR
ncbi:MAG: (d)CMP kinase [Dehalococcoidia bacterium]